MASSHYHMFVYGTLKRNEPNHHILAKEDNGFSEFVGTAITETKYPLVIASKWNIPFLLDTKTAQGHNVAGEVYKVDHSMLLKLDELENHPNYYVRRQEKVVLQHNSSPIVISCWIYFLPNFKEDLLSLPHFPNYSSSGDHGLPYVPRYLRSDDKYSTVDVVKNVK